jgi:hypothetical protein
MAIEVVRATERERKQHKLALEAATARSNAAPAEEA